MSGTVSGTIRRGKSRLKGMRLYLRLMTFFLTVFFARTAFAQPPSPHTLLWRISGKGLQKPSYLFGTLHLNDKRLFNFDDSVYRAIEKTDGLAIEVNPDEMAAYFVNQLIDQLSNGKMLKDVLGEHYFDRNRKALSKRFHKPAEEISTSDVIREKNKWMSEYMKKGEMPTFMDAWLYNVARRQGKWLGGIEDLTDQTGLINDLVDRSDVDDLLAGSDNAQGSEGKTGIERMISLYSSEDVDGIRNFTHDNSSPEQEDRLLTHRNRKMARRIDSLVQVRTMFLAIGSAHLAGDSGVINLLRQRGYAVQPVFSTRKIAASDYTFKEVHLPWVAVTDPKGHYTAEMPANPASVKLFGLVDMKFLLDLFNMTGYATMAVINSSRTISRDSLFDQLARRMLHGASVKALRSLDQHGIAGKEYMQSMEDGNIRVQLFADDRMVYMAMLSSLKKEELVSADADKFFRSFTIHREEAAESDALRPFTDSVMGIRFLSPATLEYNEKLSSESDSWKVSCFTGADPVTGAYVMLFSRDVRPGYYITADSTVSDDFRQRMRKQYDNPVENERTIEGVKAIWMSGRNTENPGLYTSALSLLKNGRNLLLVVISDSAKNSDPRLQGVFSSLHFLPRPSRPGISAAAPDGKWTCTVPFPLRPVVQGTHRRLTWVSYDTNSAVSYQVIPDTLGKYRWYSADSVFWKEKIGVYRTDSAHDAVVKDVVDGNCSGKELFVESKDNLYCKRFRFLLDGDTVYQLFVSGEKDFLQSEPVNTFFTSFRLKTAAQKNRLTERKTALLLKDMASADSANRHDAYMALYDAPFDKADAPALRHALFQVYRSPFATDTGASTMVNERLSGIVAKLDDSATAAMTVEFVKNSYGSLIAEKSKYKNTALKLLAALHTSYSYSVLKDLVSEGPIPQRLSDMASHEMRDSLQLAAGLFPAFQRWAGDTLQAATVAEIALKLLDSGLVRNEAVAAWAPAFIDAANALAPALKTKEGYGDPNLPSLLQLIGRWHTPSAYAALRGYLDVKNRLLQMEAVVQLAAGGQSMPPAILHRLASDPAYRRPLYDRLTEEKRTSVFPSTFATQAYFAESGVYQAAADDDDGPSGKETIEFVSKKVASFKGVSYTWYLYKVSFATEDGTRSYLGISGGYPPGSATLKPRKDLTGIYWSEDFDKAQLASFFKDYLDSRSKLEADE